MNRNVTLALALLAGLLTAAPAWAQVAAPLFTPAVPSPFGSGTVADNPAVMPWIDGSRFTAGATRSESVDTDKATAAETTTKLDGYHAGILLVGGLGAFAVDASTSDGPVSDGVSTFDVQSQGAAVAVPLGDSLSLGAVRRRIDIKLDTVLLTVPTTLDFERVETSFGATVRMGGWLYLGGAGGKEDVVVDINASGVGSQHAELSRAVKRFGVGIRTEGPTRWHLEYTHTQRDAAEDPSTGTTVQKEADATVVLELMVNDQWLIALAATDNDTEEPGGLNPAQRKTRQVALGFTPKPGWGLLLNHADSKTEDATTDTSANVDSLSLVYRF